MIRQWWNKCILFSCLIGAMIAVSMAHAATLNIPEVVRASQSQLDLSKKQLDSLQNQLQELKGAKREQIAKLMSDGISEEDLSHLNVLEATARSNISSLQIALADAEEALTFSKNALAELQHRGRMATYLVTPIGFDFMTDLAKRRVELYQLIDLQQARINTIKSSISLAERRLKVINSWNNQLKQLHALQNQQLSSDEIMNQIVKLQKQQAVLSEQVSVRTSELESVTLDDMSSLKDRIRIRTEIFILQENISISRLHVFLLQLRNRLRPFIVEGTGLESLIVPEDQTSQINEVLREIQGIEKTVNKKLQLVKSHNITLRQNLQQGFIEPATFDRFKQQLHEIIDGYEKEVVSLKNFLWQVEDYRKQMKSFVQGQYALRQSLPGLDKAEWWALGKSLVVLPKLLWLSLQDAAIQLYFELQQQPTWVLYALGLLSIVLMAGRIFLRKTLVQLIDTIEDSSKRFSSQLLTVFVRLMRNSIGLVLLILSILALMTFFKVDLGIWLFIVIVLLLYRGATLLGRVSLLEHEGDMSGKDVSLYNGLRLIAGLAAIFSILTFLTHALPVAYEVKVLFNKVFMLLLLALSLLLFWASPVLPSLIVQSFSVERNYLCNVIKIFCWVLPFTLLSNAIIGLSGYVDLAWAIGKYQAVFFATLMAYLVARGLIADVMDLMYERLIRHFRAGWLWAQAFVRPLDHVLRISLLVSAGWFLIHTYGFDKDKAMIAHFQHVMSVPLLNFFGNVITIPSLIWLVIFFAILYWLGKWSREFAFRWLYGQVRDIGLRYSFAIFTQYLVVTLVIIIGLRVFGVDLRGLAVVAAAFAAAAGFGLRDVVSNFFSGILLLFERPFRTGDIITLGQYEGEVIGAGLRSMKIRTIDRTDVIVPNSDMFSKPFVNWTHQDSTVRTVVNIHVYRHENVHEIQSLVLGILVNMPSVLPDPAPEVLMHELTEAEAMFEIRYYINIQIEKDRGRVRSQVLFAIWDSFEERGIVAPNKQIDVNFDYTGKQPIPLRECNY